MNLVTCASVKEAYRVVQLLLCVATFIIGNVHSLHNLNTRTCKWSHTLADVQGWCRVCCGVDNTSKCFPLKPCSNDVCKSWQVWSLAMTCILYSTWSSSNSRARSGTILSPFGHPTQVHASWYQHCFHRYERERKGYTEMPFCDLRPTCVLRFHLATHRQSVCTSWHFKTCDDLPLSLAKG